MRASRVASAVVVLLALLASSTGHAQDCLDYGPIYAPIALFELPGQAMDIEMDGDLAFIAVGLSGCAVFEMSDPTAPELLDRLVIDGSWCERIAVGDSLLCVATGTVGTVLFIDRTDPGQLTHVGSYRFPGETVADVAITGHHALVARGERVTVLDVRDPSWPTEVITMHPNEGAIGCVVLNDRYAYVGHTLGALTVIDMVDPAAPEVIAAVAMPSWCREIVFAGDLAYAVCDPGSSGRPSLFLTLDMADPALPVPAASLPLGTGGRDVALIGTRAIVAMAYPLGLVEIDVADPLAPRATGCNESTRAALATAGGRLIVAADDLRVLEPAITDPFVATTQLDFEPAALRIEVETTYVTETDLGLHIFAGTPPGALSELGSIALPGEPAQLALHGDHAYVLCATKGVQIVDVTDPTAPVIVGSIRFDDASTHAVVIDGTIAYVARGGGTATAPWGRLDVVDIADPTSPERLGYLDTALPMRALDLESEILYAVTSRSTDPLQSALLALDVTSPAFPSLMGSVECATDASHLDVRLPYAYLAGSTALTVVDVSSPGAPQVVGRAPIDRPATNLHVEDGIAYVTTDRRGLLATGVLVPHRPETLGALEMPGWSRALARTDDGLIVGDSTGRLTLVPLHCPYTPTPVTIEAFDAEAVDGGIRLTWRTAWEAAHAGFHVRRAPGAGGDYERITKNLIRPPGPYVFDDTHVEPGATYRYRLEALALDGSVELGAPLTVTAHGPSRPMVPFHLAQSQPNPYQATRGATEIHYTLACAARARLAIYDIAGRLVRRLVDERRDAGLHAATWDGKDEWGRDVASAIYFYRLEVGGMRETSKLTLIR